MSVSKVSTLNRVKTQYTHITRKHNKNKKTQKNKVVLNHPYGPQIAYSPLIKIVNKTNMKNDTIMMMLQNTIYHGNHEIHEIDNIDKT